MTNILNNKIVKIVVKTVKIILTVFIVLLASVIVVQRLSNNKVTVGGMQIFTIISESMVPKYQIGDMLLAQRVEANKLKVGDDLVYIGEVGDFKDKIVTHQIINIGQDTDGNYEFITKGIANTEEDPLVKQSQIYGRVIYKSVILSWISKIVNNSYGFYFIIFVPIVVLIFLEVMQEINYQKKSKKIKE